MITVLDRDMTTGEHEVRFDPEKLPAGIFICVLKSEEGVEVRRLVRL